MFQFFCFALVISSAKQWFCSPVSLVSITNISPCPLPFLSARDVSKRANSPVCILFEKQYTAINCPLSVTDNLSSLLTLQSSSASLVFLDTSNEFNEFSEQTTVVSSVFSDKSREVNLFCLQYNSMRFLLVDSDKTDNSLVKQYNFVSSTFLDTYNAVILFISQDNSMSLRQFVTSSRSILF